LLGLPFFGTHYLFLVENVVASEVMSSVVDWQDRNTAVLFGDGASAAVRAVSDCVETILADWSCQSNTLAPIQEYFLAPKVISRPLLYGDLE